MEHKDISPELFLDRYAKGELGEALVLDVREKPEWDYYHLPGTVLMPMNTIPDRLEKLPRDIPLYVVCAHGVRSVAVCQYLERQGWDNAVNVEGGMAAIAELRGFAYD